MGPAGKAPKGAGQLGSIFAVDIEPGARGEREIRAKFIFQLRERGGDLIAVVE